MHTAVQLGVRKISAFANSRMVGFEKKIGIDSNLDIVNKFWPDTWELETSSSQNSLIMTDKRE